MVTSFKSVSFRHITRTTTYCSLLDIFHPQFLVMEQNDTAHGNCKASETMSDGKNILRNTLVCKNISVVYHAIKEL